MPVVCEGSPTDGCLTLVSIDDYKAGEQVGIWAGNYVKENMGGKAVVLDVGLPALSTTVARSKGFTDGIKSVLPDAVIAQSVDGKGLKDEAVKVAADALTAHPDVNIIFGINDDSRAGRPAGLQRRRHGPEQAAGRRLRLRRQGLQERPDGRRPVQGVRRHVP